jgi:hypothetical protein
VPPTSTARTICASQNVSHLFRGQLHSSALNGILGVVIYSKPLISYDPARLVPAGFAC